jgi:trigger factor
MNVTVEDLSSVKKKLNVEIPAEEVARELDKAYGQLKKTAKIKGFRPGKAPRSVLERLFRKDVHADVSSRLIQESFMEAVKENDLKLVGAPKVDPPELSAKEAYRYEALVEVSPEIKDIDYRGLKLKRTKYGVSDTEVETQIKMLQKNLAKYEAISEDRAAQPDDVVVIDFECFKDGKPFAAIGNAENHLLKIGAGTISKEFDDHLIGMKSGETKLIRIKFPEDHADKRLANVEVAFNVTFREIRQEVLPEINDDLAKQAGSYESLAQLKQTVRDNLTQGYEKRSEQELNEQIFSQLLEKTEFEVPDTLVDMELDTIIAEAERSFAYRNTSMKELGITRESIAGKYRDTAFKQVKRHLILNKLIEQEKLSLSDEQLEEGMNDMAATVDQPVAEIRRYYDNNQDKLEYFKHTLLEKRAIKLIIESSEIEDVPPEAAAQIRDEAAE